MPTQFFDVTATISIPAGMGVLFSWEYLYAERMARIAGFAIIPINPGTVTSESMHFYINVPPEVNASGKLGLQYFDRFHNPDELRGGTEWDLRGRWLINHTEEEARAWAQVFMDEWNAKEEKRLAEEVDA